MASISWVDLMRAVDTEGASSYNLCCLKVLKIRIRECHSLAGRQVSLRAQFPEGLPVTDHSSQ